MKDETGSSASNYVLLAWVPLAFGTGPVIARALADSFGPATLTVFRWSLPALVIGALALLRGDKERWRASRTDYAVFILLGICGMGFCSYASFAGARTATATTVGLIYACTAAVVAAYEIVRGRVTPRWDLLAGLALCLSGVATLLTRGHLETIASLRIGAGELWSIAGMLVWAFYSLAMRPRTHLLTPMAAFTVTSIAATVVAAPLMLFELHTQPLHAVTFRQLLWLAALAGINGVAAFIGYNASLTRNGAILTSASISLAPVYIAVMAVTLIGEQTAWYHGAALALVTSGLVAINVTRSRG